MTLTTLVIIAILIFCILAYLIYRWEYLPRKKKRTRSTEVFQTIPVTKEKVAYPNWFVPVMVIILLLAVLFWFFKCSGFCVSCQKETVKTQESCNCTTPEVTVVVTNRNTKKSFVHKKTKENNTVPVVKKQPNDITDVFDDNVVIINIKQKQSQTDTSRNSNNNQNSSASVYN